MRDNIVPYIGPRFFETGDKELFFGRDYETRELCSRIIAHSVVLCYAQSGAGKTSLINAGVIPRLKEEGFDILPVARVSGQIPKELDPNKIKNIYIFNTLLNWSSKQSQTQGLTSISMNDFLGNRKKQDDTDAPQLIIFDQFEELITHYQERWRERKTFFEQVVNSLDANPRLRVIFVMREDYIAYLDPYITLFPNKLNIRFRLERMRKDAAISAIVGPIKDTDKNYADNVPQYLVDELLKVRVNTATGETITIPGEYIEPVQLQVVCQNLWSHLPKGQSIITKEYVQTFGSVDNALREFYDQAVSSVVKSNKIKEQDLRIWFEKKLITLADTRGTVFRGPKETGEIPNDIIDELQTKHIIRAEWRAGGRWYELTHDSLIKAVQDSNNLYNNNLKTQAEQYYLEGLQNFDKKLYKDAVAAFDQAINYDPDYMLSYANKSYALTEMGEYKKALETVNKVLEIDPGYIWAYNQRGIINKNLKEYQNALTDLNKAIELDSEYKWAYANKSDVLNDRGEYKKALETVNKVIEIDPNYIWAYNQRGIINKNLKEYQKAVKDFNKAIELDNKYKWAYANKSDTLNDTGEYRKALEEINKAIQIDPNYVWAYNQRGIINKNLKEYQKALADFNKAIELDKNYKLAYANKSDVLNEMGEYPEALKSVNKAIQIDPGYVWAYNQRGIINKNLKEYQKAIADYNKAIELDNEYKWAYANKSLALTEMGEYKKALESVNKAIQLDPKYVWAYDQRGVINKDLKEYQKAVKDFNKAIELDDEYKLAYADKSLTLTEMGEYEKALEAVNKAIELDPKYVWAYNQRGSIFNDLKEYQKAVKDFNKAIKLDSEYKWAHANKSYTLSEMKEYKKALESVNKAIQIDPNYAWAHNQCGMINKELKEYKKALSNFNEAIKIDPKFYDAYGYRGDVLLKLGKKSQAKKDFEFVISNRKKQLKEDPANSSLYFYLAWYSYLNGDYKQAVEAGEKGISLNPDLVIPYFNLGLAYLSLGKDDKAIKTYKLGIGKSKNLSVSEVENKFEDAKKDIEDFITLMPGKKERVRNIINTLNRSKKKFLAKPVRQKRSV